MSTVERALLSHFDTLTSRLPGVRNGDTEAIHDARVATRRLRAALPIVAVDHPSADWDGAARVVKEAGWSLGRARDLDVTTELLEHLEQRSPATAAAAAVIRARLRPEQAKRRRQLIKHLESLDLESLSRMLEPVRAHERRRGIAWRLPASHRFLVEAVREHAAAAREAIDRASGVYFPNRAHKLRIALKKLRYLVELFDAADPRRRGALRTLKTVQESLGQIHDREVLIDRLEEAQREEDVPESKALRMLLRGEIEDLYGQYRSLREDVSVVCDAFLASSQEDRARTRSRMLALTAVALPSAAVLLAGRLQRPAKVLGGQGAKGQGARVESATVESATVELDTVESVTEKTSPLAEHLSTLAPSTMAR